MHSTPWLARCLVASTLALVALLGGCPADGTGNAAPPQLVPLRVSAELPDGAREDGWSVTLTHAELVLGRITVYGNSAHDTVADAGWNPLAIRTARAHAGHAHGEADAEAALEGYYVLDLLAADAAPLATLELPPALYFDGKLRLAAATSDGLCAFAADRAPVGEGDAIFGHTLLVEGTATDPDGTVHPLSITVDAEGWVSGLQLDFLVTGGAAADDLTLVVRLDELLAAVDPAALLDADGSVSLGPGDGLAYDTLKARLQDADMYVQQGL